ncbi:hypothetical protein HK096_003425 [Nowakowskiella sp. JEL0078]|nr:hypothetical protein HK096_003425 [Nowakowskiella sp. JEL0078]
MSDSKFAGFGASVVEVMRFRRALDMFRKNLIQDLETRKFENDQNLSSDVRLETANQNSVFIMNDTLKHKCSINLSQKFEQSIVSKHEIDTFKSSDGENEEKLPIHSNLVQNSENKIEYPATKLRSITNRTGLSVTIPTPENQISLITSTTNNVKHLVSPGLKDQFSFTSTATTEQLFGFWSTKKEKENDKDLKNSLNLKDKGTAKFDRKRSKSAPVRKPTLL